MAAPRSTSFLPLALLFVLLLSFNSGPTLKMVNAYAQKYWCVAKPSADDIALKNNIDYACRTVDCRIIQEGSPCFTPDNLMSHASVVMNLYYRSEGGNTWNCDWGESGLIVNTDPSYGDCIYA